MNSLFSPQLPSKQKHVIERAQMKKGFGMADRFLYVKMARRLATCQPNLSPANYNHHDAHKKLTEYPCTTVIVSWLQLGSKLFLTRSLLFHRKN